MSNAFGSIYKLVSFGESHGPAVGGVIDGIPAGVQIDLGEIQTWLSKRRPGQSALTTPRSEDDQVEILSGTNSELITLGSPLAFAIKNKNTRSSDYHFTKTSWRPSHADYTYEQKYGQPIASGGGRASARETVARVFSGALARQVLRQALSAENASKTKPESCAYTCAVGGVSIKNEHAGELAKQSLAWFNHTQIESSPVRCPVSTVSAKMVAEVEEAKTTKDSLGGQVLVRLRGLPVGLGQPVFDKAEALLAQAMLSLPAVKGFEVGSGFGGSKLTGSTHNDRFATSTDSKDAKFSSNHSGGLQGGITNGNELYFFVAFKPTSTIGLGQQTADKSGKQSTLSPGGRHDPCVVPRAVVICEAMAWHIMCDLYLRNKISRL